MAVRSGNSGPLLFVLNVFRDASRHPLPRILSSLPLRHQDRLTSPAVGMVELAAPITLQLAAACTVQAECSGCTLLPPRESCRGALARVCRSQFRVMHRVRGWVAACLPAWLALALNFFWARRTMTALHTVKDACRHGRAGRRVPTTLCHHPHNRQEGQTCRLDGRQQQEAAVKAMGFSAAARPSLERAATTTAAIRAPMPCKSMWTWVWMRSLRHRPHQRKKG